MRADSAFVDAVTNGKEAESKMYVYGDLADVQWNSG